jgi:hypothetical protein
MSKKREVRVIVTGRPRPNIAVDAVVQIIIAFGRELAIRNTSSEVANAAQSEMTAP